MFEISSTLRGPVLHYIINSGVSVSFVKVKEIPYFFFRVFDYFKKLKEVFSTDRPQVEGTTQVLPNLFFVPVYNEIL